MAGVTDLHAIMAHIRSTAPSLQPTEQAVARILHERSSDIAEMSAQDVADAAGASRATVVRTCQSLGYSGYQQLRVLIARDAAVQEANDKSSAPAPDTVARVVRAQFTETATNIADMTALLDDEALERAVAALAAADRILVIGNGLSLYVAGDAAARIAGLGLNVVAPTDVIAQHLAAGSLTASSVALIVSGSGATEPSVTAARYARAAGANVIAVTAFSRSPITEVASSTLVVGDGAWSEPGAFQREITVTSRVPFVILVEGLVKALGRELGAAAAGRQQQNLAVISAILSDE